MADSIHVKLPDGSVKDVPQGTTALDIAKSISPRLADAALAAKTNGDLIDLTRPLEKDTDLRLLTEKDPESLDVYRHSSAPVSYTHLDVYKRQVFIPLRKGRTQRPRARRIVRHIDDHLRPTRPRRHQDVYKRQLQATAARASRTAPAA